MFSFVKVGENAPSQPGTVSRVWKPSKVKPLSLVFFLQYIHIYYNNNNNTLITIITIMTIINSVNDCMIVIIVGNIRTIMMIVIIVMIVYYKATIIDDQ